MSDAVQVRRATHGDAAALAELAASSFRETYRSIVTADAMDAYVHDHFRLDVVEALLSDPDTIVLVAVSEGRLVGYAHVDRSTPPACVVGPAPIRLSRLYLSHERLGQGIGARLMAGVLAEAARLDRKTLWLCVYEQNPRAIRFYEKHGFAAVGTAEFHFGRRVFIDPVMVRPVVVQDRQRVLVSACLLGLSVRHDGGDKRCDHDVLQRWLRDGRVVPLCPEVEGGLPVPRLPAEIASGATGADVLSGDARVFDSSGRDVTAPFLHGATKALEAARGAGVQVAVLKEGSPSCGTSLIHDGTFSANRVAGFGVTAAALRLAGIHVFSEAQLAEADRLLLRLDSDVTTQSGGLRAG